MNIFLDADTHEWEGPTVSVWAAPSPVAKIGRSRDRQTMTLEQTGRNVCRG